MDFLWCYINDLLIIKNSAHKKHTSTPVPTDVTLGESDFVHLFNPYRPCGVLKKCTEKYVKIQIRRVCCGQYHYTA